MSYTDIGSSSSGRIYDVAEGARLEDALNQQELIFLGIEKSESKKKDVIRYAIIGGASILILVLLAFAVKKKK
jgi:hypothetical protein